MPHTERSCDHRILDGLLVDHDNTRQKPNKNNTGLIWIGWEGRANAGSIDVNFVDTTDVDFACLWQTLPHFRGFNIAKYASIRGWTAGRIRLTVTTPWSARPTVSAWERKSPDPTRRRYNLLVKASAVYLAHMYGLSEYYNNNKAGVEQQTEK